MYDFDRTFDRCGTDAVKWDGTFNEYGRKDIIPMGVADMDFEILPEITKALTERAAHPSFGYTFASDAYYRNFIGWNRERNGFEIKKEEIISVPGVVSANAFILYALTEPGDKVLLCTPVYDPFFRVVEGLGRTLMRSSLIKKNGRYEMDYEDLEQKMAGGVKLFVLCNPHNPVGRVWEREELMRLSELCKKYGVSVFTDDIHSDIVFEGHSYVSYLGLSEETARHAVCAMAPSKTFNIAGLKSSMIIAKNPELYKKVAAAVEAFHVGVDLFGLKAAETAYGYGAAYVDELCAYLKENAEFAVDYIEKHMPKLKAYVPDGTYLLWVDCSALGLTQEKLMETALTAGVQPNDGAHYGDEGIGFLRLNIGTQRSRLSEALKRMEQAFAAFA